MKLMCTKRIRRVVAQISTIILLTIVLSWGSRKSGGDVNLVNHSNLGTCAVLDPFDRSITHLVEHPKRFDCRSDMQEKFSTMNSDGNIRLNQSVVNNRDVRCTVTSVHKCENSDKHDCIRLGETRPLAGNASIINTNSDFTQVQCALNGKNIYTNFYFHPRKMTTQPLPTASNRLSVVVFGIDSVSSSMFQRSYPRFFDVLIREMGGFHLERYNKVGDGSFANIIPLLMGVRSTKGDQNSPIELVEDTANIYFDHWPLIWRNYSDDGYATAYIEDKPAMGTFQWAYKGFRNDPTDHYFRPFMSAMEYSQIGKTSGRRCFADQPYNHIQVDCLNRLLQNYFKKRLFVFSFINDPPHDFPNKAEMADDYFASSFRSMFKTGLLNETILIVLSDHGPRYGPFARTRIGLSEANLPVAIIVAPTWFGKQYPDALSSLETNQIRLSSTFDVHATLIDILHGNFNGESKSPVKYLSEHVTNATIAARTSRATSFFEVIPIYRSCADAGIPKHFCSCSGSHELSTETKLSNELALATVGYVNSLMRSHAECARLILHNVRALEGTGNNSASTRDRDYSVIFTVKPSHALLHATVTVPRNRGGYVVHDPITRLNRYGNQSSCISSRYLRLFCYCV